MLLAVMPQEPPLHHLRMPMSSTSTSTMSLAILPSAPASLASFTQASTTASLPPSPSPSKRPRLSLNTTNVQPAIYGKKGATSLRLETLSATSPTARNTFRNAHHDNSHRRADPSLQRKPILAPLSTALPSEASQDDTDASDESESSISSTTTATTCSTATSATEPPYRLSYNVTSILTNGPIPKRPKRRISFAPANPMFPAQKKVSFRSPLTEDIQNTKYTMKHSDIDSSTSTISTLELSPPEQKSSESEPDDVDETVSEEVAKSDSVSIPKTGDKRDSSDEEDSENESCPATPVAGRRKRHRQWVWTLGPVAQTEQSSSDEADIETEGEKL